MSYILIEVGVRRLSDGVEIPEDDGNTDWRDYQQWLQSGGVPQPMVPPQWNEAAMQELRTRRDRLLEVISGMQSDYITTGDMPDASLCLDAKAALKGITEHPAIVATLPLPARDDFNAAVVARWKEIAAPAPLAVRAEFKRYATSA